MMTVMNKNVIYKNEIYRLVITFSSVFVFLTLLVMLTLLVFLTLFVILFFSYCLSVCLSFELSMILLIGLFNNREATIIFYYEGYRHSPRKTIKSL